MLPPDWLIEKRDEIASTNSELMGRARAGDTRPTLLVAKHQTAGRGRLGRQWQDRPGDALMFSLGLPLNPVNWSGLSLAVGLSIANSLDPEHRFKLGLKWPNDLWLGPMSQPRKLGGILIETAVLAGVAHASRYVVVGVGINQSVGDDSITSLAASDSVVDCAAGHFITCGRVDVQRRDR